MFKKDQGEIEHGEVETIIGPSVTVDGDFNAAGDVVVEGTVSGTLKTEKRLRVGENAKILANVSAHSALIAGEIHGDIKVKENLELTSSAKIFGDINTKTLSVESGAIIQGKCVVGDESEIKQTKSSKEKPSKMKDLRLAEELNRKD